LLDINKRFHFQLTSALPGLTPTIQRQKERSRTDHTEDHSQRVLVVPDIPSFGEHRAANRCDTYRTGQDRSVKSEPVFHIKSPSSSTAANPFFFSS
jgi:hypothetical protein